MACGQPLAIGGEGQAIGESVRTLAAQEFFAGGQIPELYGLVIANRDQGPTVRSYGESREVAIVAALGAGDGQRRRWRR